MPSVKSLPVVFIALALVLFSNYALPQQPGPAKTQSEQEPTYKPPIRGAPVSCVGGGSRGAGDNTPYLAVVAPDHTGFTLDEQPNLYWYLSTRATARVEITVIDDVSVKPLLEKQLEIFMLTRRKVLIDGITATVVAHTRGALAKAVQHLLR